MSPTTLVPPAPVRRFTVDEYHRMIQTGVLTEGEPYELLEGWIVHKMPQDPIHAGTLVVISDVLRSRLPPGWCVRPQVPVTTADSEPEPDVAVVRGRATEFIRRHPAPTDIALIVDVSNTTIAFDRRLKGRVYARAGIPAYWIVNVVDRRVEVFADPDSTADEPMYRTRREATPGETLPLILDGASAAEVPVAELLPLAESDNG